MRWLLPFFLAVWLYGNEGFVLIGNQRFPVDHLTAQQIKQIYLKRMRFIKGMPLVPINYVARHSLRNRFEATMLKMSYKKLDRYWAKEHYLGKRPPIVQSSVQSAIVFVREVDGAVAYIPRSMVPKDMRVLYETGVK